MCKFEFLIHSLGARQARDVALAVPPGSRPLALLPSRRRAEPDAAALLPARLEAWAAGQAVPVLARDELHHSLPALRQRRPVSARDRNDSKSGLTSLKHTANLSGLGCIEANFVLSK